MAARSRNRGISRPSRGSGKVSVGIEGFSLRSPETGGVVRPGSAGGILAGSGIAPSSIGSGSRRAPSGLSKASLTEGTEGGLGGLPEVQIASEAGDL